MKKILLFDIDGTLVRAGGAGRLALLDALRSGFGLLSPRCEVVFSGQTDGYLLPQILTQNEVEPSPRNQMLLVEHYLQELPIRLHSCGGEVLPGVAELLRMLRTIDCVRLGCMTGNLAASARMKLQHFGLWSGIFEEGHLFSGDGHDHRNEMALSAAAALAGTMNGTAFDVWVIGDTPRDIACARAMGAHVLACCTGDHSYDELAACQPDQLVEDFSATDRVASILLS